MMTIQDLNIKAIRKHLQAKVDDALTRAGVEDVSIELAPAPNPELGDYGFPVFALAKVLRKAPPLIAKELAELIERDELVAEVLVEKAYVNFKLNYQTLFEAVLGQVNREGDRFGSDQAGDDKEHWMIEYSSPNTNKPLHLGHLRNNLLGASVSALAKFYGHDVTRVNLVNDRGVHICKSMLAYKLWGENKTPEDLGLKGDHLVGNFYVRFDKEFSAEFEAWKKSAEAKGAKEAEDKDAYFNNQSKLGQQVRQMLIDWEKGDQEVVALWQKMNAWVFAGFEESYQRMGVGFDLIQKESQTYKLGKAIVNEGLEQGHLHKRDDGAVVCDLEKVGLEGEKVLLRSNGTSVYMTQDLGTAEQRFKEYDLDRMLYVVGDEQLYHFDVLFKVLGLIRPGLTERCFHLSYGMIRLPHGSMKSREGTVVDADDLMNEMHQLARAETQARAADGKAHVEDIDEAELNLRAERIGMAALKYYLLKFTPKKSFEYDPKASIDFLGQTGPYALFNYARTRSLIRKALGDQERVEFSADAVKRLGSKQEKGILQQLFAWPQLVERATRTHDPSRIAEYIFDLCKAFAYIFTDKANHPIATCEDEELRQGRLLLAQAVGYTVKAALGLLGIDVLEEM